MASVVQGCQQASTATASDGLSTEQFLSLFSLPSIPESDRWELSDLLLGSRHLFATSDFELGRTEAVRHRIDLTDPMQSPIRQRYRRIPPAMFEEVRQHIEMMLACNVIRPSSSAWSSPVVLVRKSDGGLRFCVDYRQVNACTKRDAYDLPRIEETIDCLKGAKYFSCLDLKSGYWQVEMKEEDKPITAFSVGPLGFFEFNSMPFGLCNSPATFQRLMQQCLQDIHLEQCLIYLDDIVVFSSTIEEHLERLRAVFNRLNSFGLRLKPSKCQFLRTSVKYLGHVVSEAGVAVDPDKVAALRSMAAPTNVQELQRFLGFVGYHRRFIPKFSSLSRPLNDLLVAKRSFRWEEEQELAFQTLVAKVTEAPVLAYADFTSPFILHVDASMSGLGAMLMQVQGGHRRVIAYASRSLRSPETRYPVHKLEFLALKWAVTEKFHDYLYGASFEVVTDNNPLTYVLRSAKLDATSHRWVSALAGYDFTITYQPGRDNVCADFLSRLPITQSAEAVRTMLQSPLQQDIVTNAALQAPEECFSVPSLRPYDMEVTQQNDPVLKQLRLTFERQERPSQAARRNQPEELRKLLRQWDKLVLNRGVLYRKAVIDGETVTQLLIPSALRKEVMSSLHDNMGHVGRDRTVDLVRHRVYWPGWYKDVLSKVQNCRNCICRKTLNDQAPLVPIQSSQPLELVCMDYLSLEASRGYGNVLVITDHFTKFAVAIATKNQTAHTTARVLYQDFVVRYGIPSRLHSDQGANFLSSVVKELCLLLGTERSRTTPYHPMGNGLCERFNRTLLTMLGCLEEDKKRTWKDHLSTVVHAYNCTRHASTGFSPYQLLFGRTPKLPVDVRLGLEIGSSVEVKTEFVSTLQESLRNAWSTAAKLQMEASQDQKRSYDRKQKGFALQVGDTVLVRQVGFQGPHKLANRWEKEPYEVVSRPDPSGPVYVVHRAGKRKRTVHRNMLFPVTARVDSPTVSHAAAVPRQRRSKTVVPAELDSEEEWYVLEEPVAEPVPQPVTPVAASVQSPRPTPTPPPRRSARVRQAPKRYSDLEWADVQAQRVRPVPAPRLSLCSW
jgi:transposase InsO family protein